MWSKVKVFSATKAQDRMFLGERITEWLRQGNKIVVDCEVRQSSDAEFHCLTFIIFYNEIKEG